MSSPLQFDVYTIGAGSSEPALVQSAAGTASDSTTISLSAASTPGNLLVLVVASDDPNAAIVTPSGWTKIETDVVTGEKNESDPVGNTVARGAMFYKSSAGEQAVNVWAGTPTQLVNAILAEYSGVQASLLTSEAIDRDGDTTYSSTTATCGGTVTPTSQARVLIVGGNIGNIRNDHSQSITPVAGVTEVGEAQSEAVGNGASHAWMAHIITADAPSGSYVVQGTSAFANSHVGITAVFAGSTQEFVSSLDNAFDKEFRVELDGTGMFSFKINRHESDATAATLGDGLDDFRIVKVTIPEVSSDPIWAGIIEAGDFKLLDPNEDGAEVLTFGGRGLLAYLDRAVMWSESYITGGHDPYGGLWRLHDAGTGTKPGQMLRRIIEEAQDPDRPQEPLPLLTIDFDYTNDSDGNAWAASTATAEFAAQIGESLLSVTGRLIGTRAITVQMGPDFDLHAYNDFGRSLGGTAFSTAVVRFEAGENIAEPGIRRQLVPTRVATHLLVTGEGDNYGTATLGTAVARVTREGFVSAFGSATATLNAIGTATINERLQRAESVAVPITPGTAAASGLYLPGPEGTNGHFWVGDTVRLHSGADDFDYNEEDFEVAAIEVKESDAAVLGADLDITVELGSTTILPSSSSSITTVLSSSTGGGSGSIPPHTHPGGAVVTFGTATEALGTAASAGSAITAAHSDHVHPGVVFLDEGSTIGTAAFVNITGSGGTASYSGGTVTIDVSSGGGGGGGSAVWYDEGNLAGTAAIVNITGSGGTVTVSGGTATVNISGGTAASSVIVQDEGSTIGTATVLNFTGSGGTASFSGGTATVDITGGGGTFVGARMSNSVAQSVAPLSLVVLTFNTETYDTDGFHDTSSNTSRITIPTGKAGKYIFGASWRVAANATGYRRGGLKFNGSTFMVLDSKLSVTASETSDHTVVMEISMAEGDYMEVWVHHTAGGNLNVSDHVFWCEYRGA